jgi:hypothetical protein
MWDYFASLIVLIENINEDNDYLLGTEGGGTSVNFSSNQIDGNIESVTNPVLNVLIFIYSMSFVRETLHTRVGIFVHNFNFTGVFQYLSNSPCSTGETVNEINKYSSQLGLLTCSTCS